MIIFDTHSALVANDGFTRTLTHMFTVMNGNSGIVEYIVDPGAGQLEHQRFIKGRIVNGISNQKWR